MKFLIRIYDSKLFTRIVFLTGAAVGIAFLFKEPGLVSFIGLRVSIFLGFILSIFFLISLFKCIIRTFCDFKLQSRSLEYVLVYPDDNEAWINIVKNEIEPLFLGRCLTIYPSSQYSLLSFDKWIPYAYSINKPGILFIKTDKRINLWKIVRKAAYGYPTKLNNFKIKLQSEIKLANK